MRVLLIYAKDPTALLEKYKRGEAPANFLYGLPLFHEHGITAEAYRPFQNALLAHFQSFVARRINQNLGGAIQLLRLPFIIKNYHVVVAVNHDVVISATLMRKIFSPRTKLYFIDDRAERMAPKSRMQRVLIRQCDFLIPYCQDQLRLTKKIFHGRAKVVYWGSDCSFFHRNEEGPGGDFVFSVGGDAGRDFKTLCAAAERLPRIQFIIVGRKSQLANLAIPKNVIVRYSMDISRVRDYYRKARLVVIPLIKDETELAGKEASFTSGVTSLGDCICLGKAVVISDMRWVGEYVKDGVHADVVPCENVRALTAAIQRVFSDEAHRRRIAENLYKLRGTFSIRKWVEGVSDIINSHENLLPE